MNNKLDEILARKNTRLLRDVSLWSGDLLNQAASIEKTENIADLYHIDVSDAHFVHGLLFFPDLIKAINEKTEVPLHTHLMMDDPFGHLDDFIEAGSDIISVHIEIGKEKILPIIKYLKEKDIKAGLAICVETDVNELKPYLNDIDVIVVMGTKIGIKGVGIEPTTYDRIRAIRKLVEESGRDILITSDGGIRTNTVPEIYKAGADMITPGSLVFKSENLNETIEWLESLEK